MVNSGSLEEGECTVGGGGEVSEGRHSADGGDAAGRASRAKETASVDGGEAATHTKDNLPLDKMQPLLSSPSPTTQSLSTSPALKQDDSSGGSAGGSSMVAKPSSVRKLLCLYCERSFVSATLRQKHVERVHSVKQSRRISSRRQSLLTVTPCVYCDNQQPDNTLDDLFRHLVQEHSTRYFGCLTCKDRFLSPAMLADHNAANHPSSGTPSQPDSQKVQTTTVQEQTNTTEEPEDDPEIDEEVTVKVTRSRLKKAEEVGKKPGKLRDLRSRRLTVKSSRLALKKKDGKKLGLKITETQQRKRSKQVPSSGLRLEPNSSIKPVEKQTKLNSNCVNPYPEFDSFYRVKKITDHSIDNLKISSLTFDDVFDKAFFNRIKCNIEENLLHHIDGKLFKNQESETRISNFEKVSTTPQELQSSNQENFGCELSLNAVTPVASLSLNSQFGEDFESQIEYGAKPSKKKTQSKKDEVHYKYFTRRKFQASILEQKENRDLSKLDMWTQLVIKNRQQKMVDDKKSAKEMLEYSSCDEYKNKLRREELNRILDRRGPFEDLKEEASKKAALDKLNSLNPERSISPESFMEVREVLNEILNKVFSMTEQDCESEMIGEKASKCEDVRHIPSYLNLRPSSSLPTEGDIDHSDKITLICSSRETDNFELPTNQARGKDEVVELSGEWARCRMYVCAACGAKLPNMRYLLEHKNIYHQNVWVQHYEFVGNQSELYRHLSIPTLGKVGAVEERMPCKLWKRSDARLCTKCDKQCNSLGELHRHVLECGGDWTWMLVRKKCKYKPFGTKSRRKRRGLVQRHRQKTEPTERKKYKKRFEGPRQKPSDAETIQRMLANLPAKRSTRKLMSFQEGICRARKNDPVNKIPLKAVNQKKIKCGKVIYTTRSIKENMEKTVNSQKNPTACNRTLKTLNKVLSSRILDTNAKFSVKRKLQALKKQRSARTATSPNLEWSESSESSRSTRSSPRSLSKDSKQVATTVKKILSSKLNIKSFFPVKKQNNKKGLSEVSVGDQADEKLKGKKTGGSKPVSEAKKAKSDSAKSTARALDAKQNQSSLKKTEVKLKKLKKSAKPTLTNDEADKTAKKRKLRQNLKNVLNKVKKLKLDSAASDQNKTQLNVKDPFLDEGKQKKLQLPDKIVIPSTLETKENIADISKSASVATSFNESNENLPIPETIFKLESDNEINLQAKGELNFDRPKITLETPKTIPEMPVEEATVPAEEMKPISIDTTTKAKVTPLTSPSAKPKTWKPARGLNDCIAMLTSKLQHTDPKPVEPSCVPPNIVRVFSSSTSTKVLEDPIPHKTECILKIPTFKTNMPLGMEETALDLSTKKKSDEIDSPLWPFSIEQIKLNTVRSTVDKTIEDVINNTGVYLPWELSLQPSKVQLQFPKSSVDDIIDFVVANSTNENFKPLEGGIKKLRSPRKPRDRKSGSKKTVNICDIPKQDEKDLMIAKGIEVKEVERIDEAKVGESIVEDLENILKQYVVTVTSDSIPTTTEIEGKPDKNTEYDKTDNNVRKTDLETKIEAIVESKNILQAVPSKEISDGIEPPNVLELNLLERKQLVEKLEVKKKGRKIGQTRKPPMLKVKKALETKSSKKSSRKSKSGGTTTTIIGEETNVIETTCEPKKAPVLETNLDSLLDINQINTNIEVSTVQVASNVNSSLKSDKIQLHNEDEPHLLENKTVTTVGRLASDSEDDVPLIVLKTISRSASQEDIVRNIEKSVVAADGTSEKLTITELTDIQKDDITKLDVKDTTFSVANHSIQDKPTRKVVTNLSGTSGAPAVSTEKQLENDVTAGDRPELASTYLEPLKKVSPKKPRKASKRQPRNKKALSKSVGDLTAELVELDSVQFEETENIAKSDSEGLLVNQIEGKISEKQIKRKSLRNDEGEKTAPVKGTTLQVGTAVTNGDPQKEKPVKRGVLIKESKLAAALSKHKAKTALDLQNFVAVPPTNHLFLSKSKSEPCLFGTLNMPAVLDISPKSVHLKSKSTKTKKNNQLSNNLMNTSVKKMNENCNDKIIGSDQNIVNETVLEYSDIMREIVKTPSLTELDDVIEDNKTSTESSLELKEDVKEGVTTASKKRGKIGSFMRVIKNRLSKVVNRKNLTKTKQKALSMKKENPSTSHDTKFLQVNSNNDNTVDNSKVIDSVPVSPPNIVEELNKSLSNEETTKLLPIEKLEVSTPSELDDKHESGQLNRSENSQNSKLATAFEKTTEINQLTVNLMTYGGNLDKIDSSADESSFIAPLKPVRRRNRRPKTQISTITKENSETDLSGVDSDNDISNVNVPLNITGNSSDIVEGETLKRGSIGDTKLTASYAKEKFGSSNFIDTLNENEKPQEAVSEIGKNIELIITSSEPIRRTSRNKKSKESYKSDESVGSSDTSNVNNSMKDIQTSKILEDVQKTAEMIKTKSTIRSKLTEQTILDPNLSLSDNSNSSNLVEIDKDQQFLTPTPPVQVKIKKRDEESEDLNSRGSDADVDSSISDGDESFVADDMSLSQDNLLVDQPVNTAELLEKKHPKSKKSKISNFDFHKSNSSATLYDGSAATKDNYGIVADLPKSGIIRQKTVRKKNTRKINVPGTSAIDSCISDSCGNLNNECGMKNAFTAPNDSQQNSVSERSTRKSKSLKSMKTSDVDSNVSDSCDSFNDNNDIRITAANSEGIVNEPTVDVSIELLQVTLSKRSSRNAKVLNESDIEVNISETESLNNTGAANKTIAFEQQTPDSSMKPSQITLLNRSSRRAKLSKTSDGEYNILDNSESLSDVDITTLDDEKMVNAELSDVAIKSSQITPPRRTSRKSKLSQTSDLDPNISDSFKSLNVSKYKYITATDGETLGNVQSFEPSQTTFSERASRKSKLSKISDVELDSSNGFELLYEAKDMVSDKVQKESVLVSVQKVQKELSKKAERKLRVSKTSDKDLPYKVNPISSENYKDEPLRFSISKLDVEMSKEPCGSVEARKVNIESSILVKNISNSDATDSTITGYQNISTNGKGNENSFALPLEPVQIKVSRQRGKGTRKPKDLNTKTADETKVNIDSSISDNSDSYSEVSESCTNQSDVESSKEEQFTNDAIKTRKIPDLGIKDESSSVLQPVKTILKKRDCKKSMKSKSRKTSDKSSADSSVNKSESIENKLVLDVEENTDSLKRTQDTVSKRTSKARTAKVGNNFKNINMVLSPNNPGEADGLQNQDNCLNVEKAPLALTSFSQPFKGTILTRRARTSKTKEADILDVVLDSNIVHDISLVELEQKTVTTEPLSDLAETIEPTVFGVEKVRRKLPQRRAKEPKLTQIPNSAQSSSNEEPGSDTAATESDISNAYKSIDDHNNDLSINSNEYLDVSCEPTFVPSTRSSKRTKISADTIDNDICSSEDSDKDAKNSNSTVAWIKLENAQLQMQSCRETRRSNSSRSLVLSDTSQDHNPCLDISASEGSDSFENDKFIGTTDIGVESAGSFKEGKETVLDVTGTVPKFSEDSASETGKSEIENDSIGEKSLKRKTSRRISKTRSIELKPENTETAIVDRTVSRNDETIKSGSTTLDQIPFIAPIEPIHRKHKRGNKVARGADGKQNVIDSSASEDNESADDTCMKKEAPSSKRRSRRTKEQAVKNLSMKTSESESSEDSRDMFNKNDLSDTTNSADNYDTEKSMSKSDSITKSNSESEMFSDFLDQRVTRKMKRFINSSYTSAAYPHQNKNNELIERVTPKSCLAVKGENGTEQDNKLTASTVKTKSEEKTGTSDFFQGTLTDTQKQKRMEQSRKKTKSFLVAKDANESNDSFLNVDTSDKNNDLRTPSDILHQLIEDKLEQLKNAGDSVEITKQVDPSGDSKFVEKDNLFSKRKGRAKFTSNPQRSSVSHDTTQLDMTESKNAPLTSVLTQKKVKNVADQLKQTAERRIGETLKTNSNLKRNSNEVTEDTVSSSLDTSLTEPEDTLSKDISATKSNELRNADYGEENHAESPDPTQDERLLLDIKLQSEKDKLKPRSNWLRSRSAPVKKAKKFNESRFRSKSPKKHQKHIKEQPVEDAVTDDSGIEKSIDNSITEFDSDIFERPRNLRKKPQISYVEPDIMNTPRREDSDVISIFDLYDVKRFATVNNEISAKKQGVETKKPLTGKKQDSTDKITNDDAIKSKLLTNSDQLPLASHEKDIHNLKAKSDNRKSNADVPEMKGDVMEISKLDASSGYIIQGERLSKKDNSDLSEKQHTTKIPNEAPIRIIINKQKTRRKSKSFKKTDLKGPNDLFEDFALVIKKPKKGVTPIIRFSPADTFLKDTDISDIKLAEVKPEQKPSMENQIADASVEEVDMELDEIPIPPNIIETENLGKPLQLVEINNGTKKVSKKRTKGKKPLRHKNKPDTVNVPDGSLKLNQSGNIDDLYFETSKVMIENQKCPHSFKSKFNDIPDVFNIETEDLRTVPNQRIQLETTSTTTRKNKKPDAIVDSNIYDVTTTESTAGEVIGFTNRMDEKLEVVEKELDSTINAVLQATNVLENEFGNTLELDKIIPVVAPTAVDVDASKVKCRKSNRKCGKTTMSALDKTNIKNGDTERNNIRSNLKSRRGKKTEVVSSTLVTTNDSNSNNNGMNTNETKSSDGKCGRANSSEYENMVDIFENELMRGIQIDQQMEKPRTRLKRANKKSEKEMETTIHNVLEATSVFDNELGNLMEDIENQIIPELKETSKIDSGTDEVLQQCKQKTKGRKCTKKSLVRADVDLEYTADLTVGKLESGNEINPMIPPDILDDDLDDEFIDVMRSESTATKIGKNNNFDRVDSSIGTVFQEALPPVGLESNCSLEASKNISELSAKLAAAVSDTDISDTVVGKQISKGRSRRNNKKSEKVTESLNSTDKDTSLEPEGKSKVINKPEFAVSSLSTTDMRDNVTFDSAKNKSKDDDSIYAFSECEDFKIEKSIELPLRLSRKSNVASVVNECSDIVEHENQKVSLEDKTMSSEYKNSFGAETLYVGDVISLEEKIRRAIKQSLLEQNNPEKSENLNSFSEKSDLVESAIEHRKIDDGKKLCDEIVADETIKSTKESVQNIANWNDITVQSKVADLADIADESISNKAYTNKSYIEIKEVRTGNRRAKNVIIKKGKKSGSSLEASSIDEKSFLGGSIVDVSLKNLDEDLSTDAGIFRNIDSEDKVESVIDKKVLENVRKSENVQQDFLNTNERSYLEGTLIDDISINNIDEDFLNKIDTNKDILDEICNEIHKNETTNMKGRKGPRKSGKLCESTVQHYQEFSEVPCLKMLEAPEISKKIKEHISNKINANNDTIQDRRLTKRRGKKVKISENDNNEKSGNIDRKNTESVIPVGNKKVTRKDDKKNENVTQELFETAFDKNLHLQNDVKCSENVNATSTLDQIEQNDIVSHQTDNNIENNESSSEVDKSEHVNLEQQLFPGTDIKNFDERIDKFDREKVILEEIDREIEESKATSAKKRAETKPEISPIELSCSDVAHSTGQRLRSDKIVESVLNQIDKDSCILAEIDREIDENVIAGIKTKKVTKRRGKQTGTSIQDNSETNNTGLVLNQIIQEEPLDKSLIRDEPQEIVKTQLEQEVDEKTVEKKVPTKKRSHSDIFNIIETEIESVEEGTRKRSVRSAKVKALEHIHDDALAELTESEINRQSIRKKTDQDGILPIKNTNKQPKNKLIPAIEPLDFPNDILKEKAPLLADLVADLAGLEELRNSIERELSAENDLDDVEEPRQLDEENQELRRSRRSSRKIASYNENEFDPILDALENKNVTKKKETPTKENKHKNEKEYEKKLNSDELFNMLKASTTEETYVPKPQNSFLSNLEDSSRDFNDQNFDNVFDHLLEKSTLLIKANANRNLVNKNSDKIYEFTDSPETGSLSIGGDSLSKKTKKPPQCVTPSIRIPTDENGSMSSEPPPECKGKAKANEKNSANYCEICNKSFVRVESLVKHKGTITHIQKLSEIEAREAAEKLKSDEIQQDTEDNCVSVAGVVNETSNVANTEKVKDVEHVESPIEPVTSSYSDSLKLDDSISSVLQKPVMEHNKKFVDIIMKSSAEMEPKYKRYKSLGERKSFESDSSVPADSISEPYIISKTSILEKQISLLENIIENQSGVSYTDDISVSSNISERRVRVTSSVVGTKSVDESQTESKRTGDGSFLKPAQYDEISEDSANLRNYEEQKLRKTLNRDEELFLECCSLLKSGSEVSKSKHMSKQQYAWSKDKSVPHKPPFEKANESSNGNSRIATPLGSSYDDDASDSNTISSNWEMRNETTAVLKRGSDKSRHFGFHLNEEEREPLNRGNEIFKPLDILSSENTKPDELIDAKKFMTKGARKVFEGLKVSIPTEELNMEEVLNTGHKYKKSDEVEKMEDFPKKSSRKSKPVKKAQVGSNLMFKVNKKKGSPNTNIVIQSEEPETNYDVYDFEETQDNTEVFTKPDYKAFKNLKTTDSEEAIVNTPEQESDTDSRDYLDSFTVERDSSVSSLASSVVKKPKAQENITKKKCMIMGRIFKNAAKSKVEDVDEDIRAIPPIDNDELIESYVASCKRVIRNESKPKLSESEINLLFDQLLEDKIESKEGEPAEIEVTTKPVVELAVPPKPKQDPKEVNKKADTKKKTLKIKSKKRARNHSDSTDDEFKITNTSKRSYKKATKEEDNCINLELELKECIGVASRKSQRKCTSGKQNVLVEYWSSDDSQFEAMLESQRIVNKSAVETELAQTVLESQEELVENKPEPIIEKEPEEKPPKEKKVQSKKTVTVKKKKLRLKDVAPGEATETKESLGASAAQINRRKRAATNPLYHWSSSSEDESQDLIEVKPIRDEPEDDEDRPIQHGWIVGDSPKKLVTMLAQAKGKKMDADTVKEQGKKRTASSAVS